MADEYRARGLELVLVNRGEGEDRVRAAVKSQGYRARVALDADLGVSGQYGVRATPSVFLVSRRGLIVGRAIGMREWTGAPGRAVLEALLAESPSRHGPADHQRETNRMKVRAIATVPLLLWPSGGTAAGH